jgi:intracellular sulfur oxidation DsrE/DsrF family protein
VLPQAGYVKAGIIRIVERQEQGWSYIKAGF